MGGMLDDTRGNVGLHCRLKVESVAKYHADGTTALIEGVGPPPLSVPLHRQHEDRGREATDPPTLVPSPHTDTGERPPFGACSWTGSFHAPTGYLALLATSGPPDPGSNARFKLPPSSS